MKVILLENVASVGKLGDVINVRPGYARNYLFPQRKAERASDEAIQQFETRRAELQKRQDELEAAMSAARRALDGYLLQLTARASPDGNLYGSITPQMIAVAVNGQNLVEGLAIKRGQVSLPDGQIKSIGDYRAVLHLSASDSAEIKISVLAETVASSTPSTGNTQEKSQDDSE